VLDVTREHRPPHYHVAVFVKKYETRLAGRSGSSQGQQAEYVVHRGDTLSRIAARTGVGVDQLRAINGLRSNLIKVGQKLQLPSSGSLASNSSGDSVLAMNEVTYRVSRGDTLWDIANRYGTSVQQLRRENGRINDSLKIGQVLKISKG
jgi:peptidoglycan endopeptidase LytE